jgi:hypothetical protein
LPSYRGVNIFGSGLTMVTVRNPSAKQQNDFFGLDGTEEIHGGTRGNVTEVEGVLFSNTFPGLGLVENTFRTYDDGQTGDLVDTFGNTWTDVKLERFVPTGKVRSDPFGNSFRPYKATFSHLF